MSGHLPLERRSCQCLQVPRCLWVACQISSSPITAYVYPFFLCVAECWRYRMVSCALVQRFGSAWTALEACQPPFEWLLVNLLTDDQRDILRRFWNPTSLHPSTYPLIILRLVAVNMLWGCSPGYPWSSTPYSGYHQATSWGWSPTTPTRS